MILAMSPTFLLSAAVVALWWSSSLIGVAEAHGYTTISRNFKCVDGSNFACGSIIYEPQSLEAPKGFPGAGPADGKLASAGIERFSQLDEQTPFRWLKTDVQEGPFDVSWMFTANHRTTGYEYYITNQDWNPDAPLTRSQFDLTPFCTVDGGGTQPPISGVTHNCNLPTRDGYHVILAIWIIDDTAAAFYNMIDVQYDGANPPIAPTTPRPVVAPVSPPVSTPTGSAAPTTSSPRPGALCSTGLPLEAADDCAAFVYCNNGAVVSSKVFCPGGLLFSNAAQICDWDYNVDCAGDPIVTAAPVVAPVASPVATSAPIATPTTTTNAPTTGDSYDALCSSGHPLEPVEDCAAFVYCVNGAVVPSSKVYCPSGLLFSSTTLVCDYASNVNCD